MAFTAKQIKALNKELKKFPDETAVTIQAVVSGGVPSDGLGGTQALEATATFEEKTEIFRIDKFGKFWAWGKAEGENLYSWAPVKKTKHFLGHLKTT